MAHLHDGEFDLDPVSVELAGGRLAGRASLDASSDAAGVSLTVHGTDLAGDQLLALAGRPAMLTAPVDLASDLHARGRSVAALVGALQGTAAATVGPGPLVVQDLGQLGGVLHEAGLLDKALHLDCAAVDLKAQAGVLTPDVAVVRTQYGRATMAGEVDLGAERLDLKLLPKLTGTGLDLTLPVELTGSLRDPAAAVDKSEAARRLVGLLGGSAPPPAAVGTLAGLDGDAHGCLRADEEDGRSASDDGLRDRVRKGLKDLLGN